VWNRLVVEGTFGHMIRVLDKQMMKDLDGIMILIQKKNANLVSGEALFQKCHCR